MTLHFSNLNDLTEAAPSAQDVAARAATRRGFYRNGVKRAFDVLLILLALPFALPLIAVMALLVARDGGSPFYTQTRIGQDGRRFKMWKLRTMVPNAHQYLTNYLNVHPEARAEWDKSQKLKNDPRITPLGRILRKSSIDELPQLWNVLNGTMSLVGPRPMMVSQQAMYTGSGYYNLRPGITGLWQVSDRNEGDFTGRVMYDDAYDDQISLRTDIKVLWRTVGVMLRCTGY
ncbi:MAG: sugar transferase [Pseudomonadota bacterium]